MSSTATQEGDTSASQSREQALSISVIVPTYNERENIERIVDRCLAALSDRSMELLVVDDDSPDRTWELAREEYRDDSRVRVVRRTSDKGLAQSVTEGFRRSKNDVCAVIDADLQHPPEKLPELLDALEDGADVVIGSRYLDGGGIENWSRTRKVVSKGAGLFSKALLPEIRGCSDPMSGFFAVRREIVQDVVLDPEGYKILLELLVKCDYDTIVEVPYVFRDREYGESKLTASEYQFYVEHVLMLSTVWLGTTLTRNSRKVVRMLEFFAVGALGVVVNMGVFAAFSYGLQEHFLIGGVVAFVAALNFNFVGNYAITFNRPQADLLEMYYKFNLVSLGGLVVYTAALTGAIEIAQLPALVANGVAIATGAVFNYVGTEEFAFADADTRQETTTSAVTIEQYAD
ncbi:glycosyltransferase [Halopelagius longus]|uniref:Dolichol-phosphate mannosyltransferase n=1 Tax=Halopelagius longus TaxID=1236180 RepID=A0A1H1FJM9_9EURY|nr:glycosyltransferase family 2 protein [Halopelagius longus]RDI70073.1 glycosyltransferase family 2 protein [Halopelagius longus]SDR01054.1 dolichol-phosphate mannosyltransferase [Halopelagius longus]